MSRINVRFIHQQLNRFVVCDYFPRDPETRKMFVTELTTVLMEAITEPVVTASVTFWLLHHEDRPTPKGMLDVVRSENLRVTQSRPRQRCEFCGGSGFTSEDRLITYKPEARFEVGRAERLDIANSYDVHLFRQKLGPNQDIVSVAIPCHCLPAEHPDRINRV